MTIPALAVIELASGVSAGTPLRWPAYLALWVWSIRVARSPKANTVPLILVTMGFTGAMSVVEALFGANVTAFDFTTTFGLMMMFSVLAGTLVSGNRLVWAGALASTVAVWVITVGILTGDDPSALGVRVMIAVSGVIFTIALVSMLYDQLNAAIESHDRAARLQDAIASCSEALLFHSDAFAVYEAARALLEATDADYAYVDRTVEIDGEAGWEIIADAARRSSGLGQGWKRGKYSEIPTMYQALSGGRAVVMRTRELEGDEQRPYLDDGIVSEVSVPIFVGKVMRGSIGFIQYTKDRRWTEAEIQTLWRASHMIGAYWKRQDDAEELRASNDSKDRLLASVSHEIRTPLTAIVGLSEELVSSRTSLGDEELDELNGIIALQSRELAELVEDLLVASRADFGNLSIRPENIDLLDQVRRVAEGVRESHPSSKTVTIEGHDVIAWADPLRVRQVIRNLLTNAIKYGGDRILVSGERGDGVARIVVADDGDGVPEAESKLIFERYYRSVQSPTQPGSVGIGLAVSRQLAELMSGSLNYVRTGDHPRFELTLPAAGADDDDAINESMARIG
ncbi:MAG: GAF domain-containing sensor histidine kinase [Actinobacteria bacterium]|nr:GAF domain-containing sensor histidine kinase [Actinomycetota bacterium]